MVDLKHHGVNSRPGNEVVSRSSLVTTLAATACNWPGHLLSRSERCFTARTVSVQHTTRVHMCTSNERVRYEVAPSGWRDGSRWRRWLRWLRFLHLHRCGSARRGDTHLYSAVSVGDEVLCTFVRMQCTRAARPSRYTVVPVCRT